MSRWPVARLAAVAELNPPLRETLSAEAQVSFVPMAAVSAATASTNGGEERPFAEVAKGYTPFLAGDLLVAKITPCFENGKIVQAAIHHRIGFGSTEFHVVRPRSGQADARYLLHFLRQERVRLEGERKMTGSAGQRRVPEHFLANLEVPLPPLPEQRRIAATLDRTDALRAKRRAALAQLNGLAEAIFLEMFGDPIANLRGYPQRRLLDLVDPERGISYGIVQRGDDVVDGVPVVRIGDLANGEIATGHLKRTAAQIAAKYSRTVLRGGELVISIRGTVGRCARVPVELARGNISRELALIPLRERDAAEFVLSLLSTLPVQQRISGDVKGIAQRGVNLKDLWELPVIQPPKRLVDSFRAAFEGTRRNRALQNDSSFAMEALFASVQYRAFGGAL